MGKSLLEMISSGLKQKHDGLVSSCGLIASKSRGVVGLLKC